MDEVAGSLKTPETSYFTRKGSPSILDLKSIKEKIHLYYEGQDSPSASIQACYRRLQVGFHGQLRDVSDHCGTELLYLQLTGLHDRVVAE